MRSERPLAPEADFESLERLSIVKRSRGGVRQFSSVEEAYA